MADVEILNVNAAYSIADSVAREAAYNLTYVSDLEATATITIGKTINNSGEIINNTRRAITSLRGARMARAVYAAGDTYEIIVAVYDKNSNYVKKMSETWSNDVILIAREYGGYRVIVKRKDGAVITSAEINDIRSALKVYYLTDETLTERGIAADAAATGSALYGRTQKANMILEHGILSTAAYYPNKVGLLYDAAGQYADFKNHLRTPEMLDVSGAKEITAAPSIGNANISVYEYDGEYKYIRSEAVNSFPLTVPADVVYMRFVLDTGGDDINVINATLTVTAQGKVKIIKAPDERASSSIMMTFILNGNTYNSDYAEGVTDLVDSTALLRLPPNYDPQGTPVPLIVHMHGTTGYRSKWQYTVKVWANADGNESVLARNIISYLVNEGYAVLDVFGHASNNPYWIDNYAYPYGNPEQMACISTALERVLDVYNIKDDVYVNGISAGGLAAVNYISKNHNVKACSLQAPTISATRKAMGLTGSSRKEWAWSAGFDGDISLLDSRDGASDENTAQPEYTAALLAYLRNNADKMVGYNPYWNSLTGVPQGTLNEWAFDINTAVTLGTGDHDPDNWTDKYRSLTVPIRIWVANDDTNISPVLCHNYIKTLRNGQSPADEVIIPNGQGGHYAFSTSNTVPVVSGKTALGYDYSGIPWPWVDLVKWYRRH